jgi:DnaJ family protein C protein 19
VTKQGRAGLVAFKRYRGGTSAVGKAFYKGGFEQKMTRKEAALILETTFVFPSTRTPSGSND